MPEFSHVHWYEGQFLQVHHFQLMQRDLLERISDAHLLSWPYPYGLIDLEYNTGALENRLLQVSRLRAVMPSGLVINYPATSDLKELSFKEAYDRSAAGIVVHLGVPLYEPDRPNTMPARHKDDGSYKRLFHVDEVERADENIGDNRQPIQIRRINARLLLEPEKGMETIPVLRIVHPAGEKVSIPRVDPRYFPPCLVLDGWIPLRDELRAVTHEVLSARSDLVVQITRPGFAVEKIQGGQALEQLLRLRVLNVYASILQDLLHEGKTKSTTPFEGYMALRQLLSELAALRPDLDPFNTPAYDHDNLAHSFRDLIDRIRLQIRPSGPGRFLKLAFAKEGAAFVADLATEHVSVPNGYYLGVKSRDVVTAVAAVVQNRVSFKFMPKSLKFVDLPGIRLEWETRPPVEFDSQNDLHYFRLRIDEDAKMWERIRREKAIAVHWPGADSSSYEMSLYMTVPDSLAASPRPGKV